MSFSLAQLKSLCQEVNQHLLECSFKNLLVLKLHRFSFLFAGQKHALFFCFESPFQRFHLTTAPTISQNISSHPLQKALIGKTLKKIEQLNGDRILKLTFASADERVFFIGEFFSKHPNYYLIDSQGLILFSLFPVKEAIYQPPPCPFSSQMSSFLLETSQEVENHYAQLEQEWLFQKEKKTLLVYFQKHVKHLEKRKQILEQNRQECSMWQQDVHEGELLKAHFHLLKKGLPSIEVWDWEKEGSHELKLDPRKTPQEEVAARFRRAKKKQTGLPSIATQLEQTQQLIDDQLQLLKNLEGVTQIDALLPFKLKMKPALTSSEKAKQASLPYHEYRSKAGLSIWVGKNARANDKLTFSLAKGSDWWLHTQGQPGSHVIIRVSKGQEPDPETLADACQLALYYSKARNQQEAEICLTQRKYVSPFRKQLGKVQISKHQTIWTRFDPQRYQALKGR